MNQNNLIYFVNIRIILFVFQPVFKMETYEEDMEIAEVIQGFVYL